MASIPLQEEIFDEEADESSVIEKEWTKVKDKLEKEGYREGLEHGHGTTIQHGFNKSYRFTAVLLYKLGDIKGRINAVLSIAHLKPETITEQKKEALERLLSELSTYNEKLTNQLKDVNTAKLIVYDMCDTVPIIDQSSSMYVEDDITDFLGLKSDASSDSDVMFIKDNKTDTEESELAQEIDDISCGTNSKKMRLSEAEEIPKSSDCEIKMVSAGNQQQLDLLTHGINLEISKFESDYLALISN